MRRPGLTVLVLVLVAAIAGGSAGWLAGQRSADSTAAVATSSAQLAAIAHEQADLAAAAAATAEAAARNSTAGICWTTGRGVVEQLAPPIAVPGGFTCPAGPWRWTPVEPQPAPTGAGVLGR